MRHATQTDTGPEGPARAIADLRTRITEANRRYVETHQRLDLPAAPRLGLAVVACMDCRLSDRLEEALGLGPGDAYVIRVAGNTTGGTDDLTRSLAVVTVEMGVRHVLVVGHTGCGMARIDPVSFAAKMAERGARVGAATNQSVKEWLGIFQDEAKNVLDTIAYLRASGALPADVDFAGALVDIATLELTWLATGPEDGSPGGVSPAQEHESCG